MGKLIGPCAVLLILQLLAAAASASDPELTQDYASINATADFFTFTGFRRAANTSRPGTFKVVRAFVDAFPALQGLGISSGLLEFQPGSHSAPHIHPRGSELLYVMEGSLMVGFVDTAGHFFNQTLGTGDLFVFPKGLLHFEFNPVSLGQKAVALSSFSGSNPATISIPATLFGSGIPNDVLAQAFQIDAAVLAQLQAPFAHTGSM